MGKTRIPRGYEVAYSHPTLKEARAHTKDLRRSHYGIMKRRIYFGVKIKKTRKGYTVLAKETKGWLNWLRTGKG